MTRLHVSAATDHDQANAERKIGLVCTQWDPIEVHTLLDLLYVLYWPDDGPLQPKHVAWSRTDFIISLCWYIDLCLDGNIYLYKINTSRLLFNVSSKSSMKQTR